MKNLSIDENNSIFILHLNISSLQKHFDELHELLLCLPSHLDILCITETRIADTPLCNIELPNYNYFYRKSPNVVGGVGLYIKHGIQFEFIENII